MSFRDKPFLHYFRETPVPSVPKARVAVSYGELLDDLSRRTEYIPYFVSGDLYRVLENLTAAILSGNDITLLDSHLTEAELSRWVGPAELNHPRPLCTAKTEHHPSLQLQGPEDFLAKLEKSTSKITLFTSGTTGQPKKITHDFQRLALSAKRIPESFSDIWGFAFSPTHMAGLQVFIQTLFNQNTLVDLFGMAKQEVVNSLREHRITHLSATPTFYRLLLPVDFRIDSLQRVTLGGERSDEALHAKIQKMFPSARISNIYASTEAGALLKSRGGEFEVKEAYREMIRVQDGELWIHKSLTGMGVSTEDSSEWYATSDLVEVTCDHPLRVRFIARKNEMINVGGFKVNPTEVESAFNEHPGILNALVHARKNSVLGNMLVAQVQAHPGAKLTEKDVRSFLESRLQPFKIPRIIKFVESLEMTHTGKAKQQ